MNEGVYDYRGATDSNGYIIYDTPDDFETISFFYNENINKFINEGGYIVWNMLEYVTSNDLYLFKHGKETIFVPHCRCKGTLCELYYPEEDEDSECITSLYYISENDSYEDLYGVELYNLPDLMISPDKLRRHKEVGGTLYTSSKTNPKVRYEIVFPIEEDEDDI